MGAQVSGGLEKLNLELGQTVHEGELIALIDAQTQTNALKTARAALATIPTKVNSAAAGIRQRQARMSARLDRCAGAPRTS